ncbi:macro domain-containing protein [Pseudomonas aeruginosa]|uniref:macro domain-containing protein n=1 Tax=Pseudomonas aeruginosa TaxID=287 RepID=UPI00073DE7B5|nr:macro domain-containing protein [Pseudomonas aeruginosa]ALV81214.1 Macro domain protein [Pseudomonas aeruginosa]EKW0328935.1 macro domain-containing protein [Pseudomonas aeruginosa]EKW2708450.1 macro domain-containing protein [Pseudomonas aeruginosa]EKW3862854.1 macro domain-containing protein [Pseudomonas aeruginosa]MBC9042668.1 macro domain-containing protein [Pseudomonas aeruginosa]
MSNVSVVTGNIFCTRAQTCVNTINCVGVMGAGIAFEYRLRYPDMFQQYRVLCEQGQIGIGKLWIYKAADRWVLNFPTKKHWRYPSQEDFLHAGLEKFMGTYKSRGISSVAFPLLGAQMGGLSAERSLEIMLGHLSTCTIPVEIYRYDPVAPDDLYEAFKASFLELSSEQIKVSSGLRSQSVEAIRKALAEERVCQLNQLLKYEGIGDKTLEKAYSFVAQVLRDSEQGTPVQASLL